MSLRLGIDLAAVEAVREALTSHGDRYLARIYTEREVSESCSGRMVDPQRLAACFAAKEATLKVLAVDEGISLRDIELRRDQGKGRVVLCGRAREIAASLGIGELIADISHARGLVAAVVLAAPT